MKPLKVPWSLRKAGPMCFQLTVLENAGHNENSVFLGVPGGVIMDKFEWPFHIKFDDSQADISEARRVWLNAAGQAPRGGGVADFLEFMNAYATELEKRRRREIDRAAKQA